jgi:Nif-specific regulatory protein
MTYASEADSPAAGERVEALLDINQALTGAPNFRSALRRVLEILSRQYGMIRSAITLLSPDGMQLNTDAVYGFSGDGNRARYRVGEGITGKVVESCKPVVIPQVSKEPSFLNRAGKRDLDREEISYICVPIVISRRAAGALAVDLPFRIDRDYDGDVRLLRLVASMIGQALKLERMADAERQKLIEENTHLREELR